MPQFKYSAKETSGGTTSGIVEAVDSKEAIAMLRKKQLIIISMTETKPKTAFSIKFNPGGSSVNVDDVVVFSRQLATLVEAGIPLFNSLDILAEQMEKPELRARIGKIRDDVEAGASLSEAMSKDKQFFSNFFVNMVKAGETSGTLDEILDRLATYIEKSSNLQKKVSSAMIYPAVVSVMALSVTLIMLLKVIPVFKEIYGGFNAALPGPTQMLMNVSDFLKKYFLFIGIAGFGFFTALASYARTTKGSRVIDNFKLNVPVFGIILRKVAVSKFSRTFSTLIRSGVPILGALDIVGKTAGNVIIEDAVEKIKVNVKEGEDIAGPLSKLNVFPPMVIRMIGIGEKTGELEKMLTKVAEFYEAQVDTAVSGLTSIIEPIIIAFLGIVIGGIVICMFLPILQISTIINVNVLAFL